MNTEIIRLGFSDSDKFSELVDVYEEVFEMENFKKPPVNYLEKLLAYESVLIFAATDKDKVIGGLTAYVLPSPYFQSAEVYVYDLAVKTEYQRRGIGTKLMQAIKDYCGNLGMKEVFLQADYIDQHAVDFYTKIGGVREDVIHFSFALKSNTIES